MNEENNIISVNKEADIIEYDIDNIKNLIYTIREQQVMLDSDVAMLYHYETKYINLAVKRNKERFPENFCFQLTDIETENYGGRRTLPYVFTEQGIAMLSGLLKNHIAVQHCGASLKDLGKKCFAISKIKDMEYIKKLEEAIL